MTLNLNKNKTTIDEFTKKNEDKLFEAFDLIEIRIQNRILTIKEQNGNKALEESLYRLIISQSVLFTYDEKYNMLKEIIIKEELEKSFDYVFSDKKKELLKNFKKEYEKALNEIFIFIKINNFI